MLEGHRLHYHIEWDAWVNWWTVPPVNIADE